VLKFMGSFLAKELKGKDFAARYGGEEFIILLLGTSVKNAYTVADNLRKNLSGVQLRYVKTGQVLGKITISAGVSTVRKSDTGESLVLRADNALYLAKQDGRNKVKTENDIPPDNEIPRNTNSSIIEFEK
jgi:diguanylate cyclase